MRKGPFHILPIRTTRQAAGPAAAPAARRSRRPAAWSACRWVFLHLIEAADVGRRLAAQAQVDALQLVLAPEVGRTAVEALVLGADEEPPRHSAVRRGSPLPLTAQMT